MPLKIMPSKINLCANIAKKRLLTNANLLRKGLIENPGSGVITTFFKKGLTANFFKKSLIKNANLLRKDLIEKSLETA